MGEQTILIVDDDPDIREIVAVYLEAEGYHVTECENGLEAVASFDRSPADLIVLDVDMPRMSGIEACAVIRRRSDVPVIFLSSHGTDTDRIRGLSGGADDYMTKPFLPEELVLRVNAVLRRSAPPKLGRAVYDLYCPECITCAERHTTKCAECDAAIPEFGWALIANSEYEYLGRVIDERYTVEQFLGSGAMGWVYRVQSRKLKRSFAFKIVDSARFGDEGEADEILDRFGLEIEAMSKLTNPHIVSIYETFKLKNRVVALLMDLVEGPNLQQLLDRVGRLSTLRTLNLVRQIANGVFEAHEVGIVHCDLKPANIVVERLPASGYFASILDFGVARVVGQAALTDKFTGTPLYASPEQCLGEATDHRADIYSLGCIIFACLTGKPPFAMRTALKAMEAHVYRTPDSVSDRMGQDSIPPALDDLVARMLEKDPDARPASMREVIAAIDGLLADLGAS